MPKFKDFKISELFTIEKTKSFNKNSLTLPVDDNIYDYVTRSSQNRGINATTGFVNKENINHKGTFSLGLLQMDTFYRNRDWYAGQFVRKIVPKIDLTLNQALYFEALFSKLRPSLKSVLVRDVDDKFLNSTLFLPINDNESIDFKYIEEYIANIQKDYINRIEMYLKTK